MDQSIAVQIAATGWAHVVSNAATAASVASDRLTTTPLWRVEFHGRHFALRGWSEQAVPQALAADRYLRHIACPPSVTVPLPIATSTKWGEILHRSHGWGWELTPWLKGEPGLSAGQGPRRYTQLTSACRMLAHMHLRGADLPVEGVGQSVTRHFGHLRDLEHQIVSGEFSCCDNSRSSRWWHAALPCPSEAMLLGARRAIQVLQPLQNTTLPTQWIWGDAWHHNFLFAGDQVVGAVDFATVRTDTPMADLARLLGSVADREAKEWQQGLASYDAKRRLTEAERLAVDALHHSGTVLSLANWLRWLYMEGRYRANRAAAEARLTHFAGRLATLLNRPV